MYIDPLVNLSAFCLLIPFCNFRSFLLLQRLFFLLIIFIYRIYIRFCLLILKFTKNLINFLCIWRLSFSKNNILEPYLKKFKFELLNKLWVQFLLIDSLLKLINRHLFIFNLIHNLIENNKLPFSFFLLFLFVNFLYFFPLFCLFKSFNKVFNKLLVFSFLLIQKRQLVWHHFLCINKNIRDWWNILIWRGIFILRRCILFFRRIIFSNRFLSLSIIFYFFRRTCLIDFLLNYFKRLIMKLLVSLSDFLNLIGFLRWKLL